jgi:hypothetical protein
MFLLDDQSVDCEHEVTGSKSSLTYASGSAIKVTTKVSRNRSEHKVTGSKASSYFRTVPGKQYGVQWNDSLSRDPDADWYWWNEEGLWRTGAVVTATTTQTRFVFNKPATQAFYRVILAQ